MKVKAIAPGYFEEYRKPGTVFEIPGKQQLGSWMEVLEQPAPAKDAKAEPKQPAPAKADGK